MSPMATTNQELKQRADDLYERYGEPLAARFRDQFVAIMPDGRTLVGATRSDVAERALREFGRGSFIFHLGDKAVGRWR